MLAEKGEDFLPAVHGLLHPVHGPVGVEEAMARAVVTVEFVDLAVLLQFFLVPVHLFRARRGVLIAEQAEQRTG